MLGWLIVSLHLKFLSLEKIVSETDYLQVNYRTTELIRRQAYMLLVWTMKSIDWKGSYWIFFLQKLRSEIRKFCFLNPLIYWVQASIVFRKPHFECVCVCVCLCVCVSAHVRATLADILWNSPRAKAM